MAKLIQNRRAATDSWLLLKAAPEGAVPSDGDIIVPLAQWQAQRDALLARNGRTGVWVDAGEDPDALVGDLAKLQLIALNFPKFGDGRNLTTARLLRERHGYKGAFEIAATVDYMFAFAATTGAVRTHHFDLAFDAFIADDATRAVIGENNPAALKEIAERFREAAQRGLWTPRLNSALHLLEELSR